MAPTESVAGPGAASSALARRWEQVRAVVLLNLGTPDEATTPAVRRYLREFLMDPRVIDIPPVQRWLLVNGIIAPFRAPKSAAKYRLVWTPQGSPLMVHSKALHQAVQAALPGVPVLLAMRYGNPSIAAAVEELRTLGASEVVLVPLFPHYASAAWGSAADAFLRAVAQLTVVPSVKVVPPFFDDEGYVAAKAAHLARALDGQKVDHVVFSYHGLPMTQVRAACPDGECPVETTGACCARLTPRNRGCYRAQCVEATRLLAERAGIPTHSTAFQSRLGRAQWIGPQLDRHVVALAQSGVKRLAVTCPAFVADCLETLEEVAMGTKEAFLHAGGEHFVMVPALNTEPAWVQALTGLVRRQLDAR